MDAHRPAAIRLVALAILFVAIARPVPASAQTADEFFAGESFDDLWVHINARDWQALRAHYEDETFYPCDLQWRSVRVYNAGCKSRGYGSRNGIKPGLDIRFDRYVTGQRFLGVSELVLDNLWQDRSMLQERLTMALFRSAGVAASREAHVKLFVGSAREFAGVYVAVEAIDTSFLQRAFGSSDGYLYEYRWRDIYQFEDLGVELEPYAYRFAPRTHVYDSMFALYAPVRDLITAINEAPLDQLDQLLDLQSVIAELAVENYVSDWDGLLGYAGLNNFYLYRAAGAPVRVIPWDKDTAFFDVTLPPNHNMDGNVLARRIWNDAGYRRRYLQALLDVAAAAAPLELELEREYEQIQAVAFADPLKPETNEEFLQAIDGLRAFVGQRQAIVRRYVRGLAPDLR